MLEPYPTITSVGIIAVDPTTALYVEVVNWGILIVGLFLIIYFTRKLLKEEKDPLKYEELNDDE